MIEHPILMSAPTVRATLEDAKTQTRRVCSPRNSSFGSASAKYWPHGNFSKARVDGKADDLQYLHVPCHATFKRDCKACAEHCWYGTAHRLWPRWWPKDSYCGPDKERPPYRLWVRETFAYADVDSKSVVYRADLSATDEKDECWLQRNASKLRKEYKHFRWRPSIHIPRWASRLTLEILKVRVERVQDISEEDAKAEGAINNHAQKWPDGDPGYMHDVHRRNFCALWDSINGKRKGCSWKDNPWVWAIEFKRLQREGSKP